MTQTANNTQTVPNPEDAGASSGSKKFGRHRVAALVRTLLGNRLLVAVLIFTAAFALRAGHVASLEHRVWYLEDAQNYLRSGNAIYRTVTESKTPAQLIENISSDAKQYSGIYHAFDSDKLVDRMLTDGAIFPLYLSVVEAASGLNPRAPQYESIAFKTSLANSAIDSLTCVFVYLAGVMLFGSLPGILAGVLYAVYPAAVVNTQWCMSETFCTFMLVSAVYAFARFLTTPPEAVARRTAIGAATGAILGLTVLSRPAFPFVLPFLAAAAFFGTRTQKKFRISLPLIVLAVTFCLTVTPWLLYTQQALGQPRLTTNRLPAFNLISGNLSTIDGWTPFPNKLAFPESMKEAAAMVAADAASHPVDFALLQMKKLPRLWSSVWNDCKYTVSGFNHKAQTVFHQLLLFLALCWGFIVCTRGRRDLSNGELLGTALVAGVLASHVVYQAFIALARYAFTAMPFVILAASAAIAYCLGSGRTAQKHFLWTVLGFAVVAAITNEFRFFSHFAAGIIAEDWWLSTAPWFVSVVAILAFALVWLLAVLAIRRSVCLRGVAASKPHALLALVFLSIATTGFGIIGSIIGSQSWSEWKSSIANKPVQQIIQLPSEPGHLAPTGFVVMDLHSEQPLPQLQVELNGQLLKTEAIPVSMIQKDNESIVRSLSIQAQTMDMDFRALRHWYAVPFPTDLLHKGGNNTITVKSNQPVTVYGDYITPSKTATDGIQRLPSINSLSWNYAVEGSEFREPIEPRPLEMLSIKGKTVQSSERDLSTEPGRQWGRYRIRFLLRQLSQEQAARATTEAVSIEPIANTHNVIFSQKADTPHTVHGGNPMTFYITDKSIPVSEPLLKRHPIKFTCELKTEKHPANAFINLVFKTGIGDVWTPPWQPDCIPVDAKGWKKITIVDSFPKLLLEHDGVSVRPVVTPFGKDLVFTNKNKAGKQSLMIRNARLEFLDTEIPERKDLFAWKVF